MKFFSTREAADLLSIPAPRVRAYARVGYITPARGPRRAYRFSFQDLVLLRTAKGLVAARVPSRRINRALRKLVRQLPRGRSLSEVRITAEGGRIVVRDGDTAWNPESGQVQLDFSVADLAAKVAPLARRAARAARRADAQLGAGEWYDLGCDLEAVAPDEAREAYRRALALDPDHADSHVNLGRLLQEAGILDEAVEHYRAALVTSPRHPTAAFNLGVALEDLDQPKDAIQAYRKALEADPDYADAHFNLSRLYERAGRRAAALAHLKSYRTAMGRG